MISASTTISAVCSSTEITDWATLPRFSAPRQAGETSMRSITPLSMSSMKPIPVQPALDTASITTIPGVRKSR